MASSPQPKLEVKMIWLPILTAIAACLGFALSLFAVLRKPPAIKADADMMAKLGSIAGDRA